MLYILRMTEALTTADPPTDRYVRDRNPQIMGRCATLIPANSSWVDIIEVVLKDRD
jgi:hypothetical protein